MRRMVLFTLTVCLTLNTVAFADQDSVMLSQTHTKPFLVVCYHLDSVSVCIITKYLVVLLGNQNFLFSDMTK